MAVSPSSTRTSRSRWDSRVSSRPPRPCCPFIAPSAGHWRCCSPLKRMLVAGNMPVTYPRPHRPRMVGAAVHCPHEDARGMCIRPGSRLHQRRSVRGARTKVSSPRPPFPLPFGSLGQTPRQTGQEAHHQWPTVSSEPRPPLPCHVAAGPDILLPRLSTHRNMIARCMLGMTALVFMALWQDWREGGYSQTPVVFGVGATTLAYLLACTVLMDKEVSSCQPSS